MIATLQSQPNPWELPWITGYCDSLIGISLSGSNVTDWGPAKGSLSFSQATDARRLTYANGELTAAAASSQWMQTGDIIVNQPFTMFAVMNPTGYNSGTHQVYLAGKQADVSFYNQTGASNIQVYAGTAASAAAAGPTAGSYYIVTVVVDGTSTYWRVNLGSVNTDGADAGANNPGGFTLAAVNTGLSLFASAKYKAFGYVAGLETAAQETQRIQSMGRRYGIAV